MSELTRLADQIGNSLTSAGIGLETIANLLGADGSEHHLSDDDLNGLQQAVLALGSYIKSAGYDLYMTADAESAAARASQEVAHG